MASRNRRVALTVVLVLSFVAAAWIASPLWIGLVVGVVLAFAAQRLHEWIAGRVGGRRALAAAIVAVLAGAVFAVAGGAAMYVLTTELLSLVKALERHVASGSLEGMVGESAARLLDRLHVQRADVIARLHQEFERATGALASAAGVVVSAATNATLGLIIAILTMYYVLVGSEGFSDRIERVLPLDPRHTRALLREFRDVARAAIVGTLVTALIQGTLAGIAFAIARVPQPVAWATLVAFASFLPLAGTAFVWAPVGLYLLFSGHPAGGIFVLVWGALLVVGFADYVVRPRVMGPHGHVNPLVMLVAIIGGIEVMGLAGLVVAPIVMSLFLAVLRIYEREVV
jgi:predicted PurR-regulated permease PerM